MSEPVLIHEVQPFKNLENKILAFTLWQRRPKIRVQVPVWKVLHGYKYAFIIVVPAEGLDEALLVLDRD